MEITPELAELVGIIIGDGNIHYNQSSRSYFIEITGNLKEKEYYNYISRLFVLAVGKPGRIRLLENCIKLRIYSKEFVEFLIKDLRLCYNKGKCYNVEIPETILNSEHYKECIRGIFDTDGSYFFSKKSHTNHYPCIEITTCSKKLANQITYKLRPEFRTKLREDKRRNFSKGLSYKIALNGKEETQKWFKQIGSSNPYKYKRK